MKYTTYTNPVLFCDYSDPDVISDGSDGKKFYMTASSFNYTPGLPVLESADLVNWHLINYAASRIPLSQFDYPRHAKGLWAPSIRYHSGRYIITVAMPDEGIFVTEATDPRGNWSPLRCIWKGRGFIDPCPIWDDNGKVWIVHAYAKSRAGINSMLGILEADPDTLDCKAESFTSPGTGGDEIVFDGRKTQPTIEGPKIYKRNGLYYIFAPAGGVQEGWQTVLRSRSLKGPYEEKIVMARGASVINGPHQGALVGVSDGTEWFIHFQSRGVYGRIIHLQPVVWRNGWPCMGTGAENGKFPGEPVMSYRKTCQPEVAQEPYNDGLKDWQWTANSKTDFIYNTDKCRVNDSFPKGIALSVLSVSSGDPYVLWNCANILTKKISSPSLRICVEFDISNLPEDGRAGVILLGNQYASAEIYHTRDGMEFRYIESVYGKKTDDDDERQERIVSRSEIFSPVNNRVSFFMNFKNTGIYTAACSFSMSANLNEKDNLFTWVPSAMSFVPETGHWVGCRTGLYAVGKNTGSIVVTEYKEIKRQQ